MPPHPSDPSLAITSFDKPPHPQFFPRLLASAADMHLAAWAVTTATPAFTRGVRCQDGDPIQNPEEVPSIQSPALPVQSQYPRKGDSTPDQLPIRKLCPRLHTCEALAGQVLGTLVSH